jgi:hypothetical protein
VPSPAAEGGKAGRPPTRQAVAFPPTTVCFTSGGGAPAPPPPPPPPVAQLDIAFRQCDAAGQPLRQGPPEIAAALGLPLARAQRLLVAAKRAVPLAADHHPVEVLYEDEDLVAGENRCCCCALLLLPPVRWVHGVVAGETAARCVVPAAAGQVGARGGGGWASCAVCCGCCC